jgi:TetR/AcrR family transcriptional regulator
MVTQRLNRNGAQKAAIREENERIILEAAEDVFANYGYEGATTSRIARQAGIPKANLHYYFPTKTDLYRRVIDNIFNIWLEAADSFDDCDDPVEAITRYISKKMDISRDNPKGSKVWANEIIQRAPIIQDYLETTLKTWTNTRADAIQRWIDEGRIADIKPDYLLYMIWATTQHYADFGHQVKTLNGGNELSDEQFAEAKKDVTAIILRGIGAIK